MKAPAFVADLGATFIADMKNPVNEGYPIFAFQDNTPKYEAVFTVNPENADFKVFDAEGTLMSAKQAAENGVHRYALKAGKYNYEVSAFGYTAQKKNFEVTEKRRK